MKAQFLSFMALAALATLVGCGGGGGGGNGSGGGGGGTRTTIADSYRVVAIPAMVGGTNTAEDVNDAGQVVGTSGAPGSERAFYWDATNGLVSLHGSGNPADATSFGLGVNSRGEASGMVVVPSFGFTRGFFALQSGGGFMVDSGAYSRGNAINSNRLVVGSNGQSEDTRSPFAMDADGGTANFGAVTGLAVNWSDFTDVNEAGDTVGIAELTSGGRMIAFVKAFNQVTLRFESPNAGEDQVFSGINNAGNICGTRGNQAIFKAAGVNPTVIGGLTGATLSEAHDISDGNVVVGHSNFGTLDRAFAWTQAQGMVSLQTRLDGTGSGWVLNRAHGISANGRIVGVGTFGGVPRAFMLVPN